MISEREFDIPAPSSGGDVFDQIRQCVQSRLPDGAVPIRFAVTRSDGSLSRCEVGALEASDLPGNRRCDSIFDFARRPFNREDRFTTVLLVPTGIGARIGGHSGDATPFARLLAGASDTLITHPTVVNAADLNERTEDTLYVEGSVICRLMMGRAGLARSRGNRILVIAEDHEDELFTNAAVNAANAARASAGVDVKRVVMGESGLDMRVGYTRTGRAAGCIEGFAQLCRVVEELEGTFDAVALTSVVKVARDVYERYFHGVEEIANPFGGVEAMLTHALSSLYDVPAAHSPMYPDRDTCDEDLGILDPRVASEGVTLASLFCVLKGLHRSPRLVTDPELMQRPDVIDATDLSCLVIPDGCVGLPTLAALAQGIPVIAVRENENLMRNDLELLDFPEGMLYRVDSYLEAAGLILALKNGVAPSTLRRDRGLAAHIEYDRTQRMASLGRVLSG